MRPLFSAYQGDGPYAFVCYAHADAEIVYPDMQWLNEHVCPLWYDEGIAGGSVWRDEIAGSILGARLFIFYLTPRSQQSEECLKEVGFALDNGVPLLCVLPEPCEITPGLKLSLQNRQALERYRYEAAAYQVKVSESVRRILSGSVDRQTRPDRSAANRSRYELNEKIIEDEPFVLWTGIDRVKRRGVMVKQALSGAPDLGLEYRALTHLRHPNLAAALDFGIDAGGDEYLVLDLPDLGHPLSHALRDAPRHQRIELIAQALRALHQIHARGYRLSELQDRNLIVHDDRVRLLFVGDDAPERAAERDEARETQHLNALGRLLHRSLEGDFDPRFRSWLDRLTHDAGSRPFPHAADALMALKDVSDDLVIETALTRESTLQTAEFVGRDSELNQLERALEAAQRGHGHTILVGGESGVGKSRLVVELETNARLRGIQVMRGIAADGDTGSYKLWEPVVRHLSMLCRADAEPSVALDDNSFLEIEQLLIDQSAPVMIVLEDIHWAGSESLKLLSWLARPVLSLPIIIVGTFRNNEGFDPEQLGVDVRTLHLARLSADDVGRLASAVLGFTPDARLLDFLARESEGNSLFIVETLRELAEEAGSLAGVGRSELPESVLSGGMRRILRRRVQRLGEDDLPVLKIAALIGRSIEPALMMTLLPELDLDAWADRCVSEAVLEDERPGIRFSHDKIREYLISDIAPDERKTLHRRIAEALASLGEDSATLLAFHWAEAGDRDREAGAALIAGRQNLESGALAEAVAFFARAVTLIDSGSEVGAGELDPHTAGKAGLSDGYYRLGNLAECTAHSLDALRAAGERVPTGAAGRTLKALLSMFRRTSLGANEAPDSTAREVARAYLRLTDVYFYALDQSGAVWSTLRAEKVAARGGCRPELAQSYALMGALTAAANLKGLGRSYARKALLTSRQTRDIRNRAWVATRLAVQSLSDCDWPKARSRAEMARRLAERAGDLRIVEESSSLRALTDMFPGRFADSAPQFARMRDLATRIGDRQVICWGAQGEAISLIRLGRSDEAREIIAPTVDVTHDPFMRIESINTHAILAVCDFRSGEAARAQSYAETVVSLLADTPPMAYWTHSGISFLMETLAGLSDQRDSAELAKLRKRALKCLDTFASSQRLGRPLQSLYHGLESARNGKRAKATSQFAEGIQRASEMSMRYEETMLHLAQARLASNSLDETLMRSFEEMGCRYELSLLGR